MELLSEDPPKIGVANPGAARNRRRRRPLLIRLLPQNLVLVVVGAVRAFGGAIIHSIIDLVMTSRPAQMESGHWQVGYADEKVELSGIPDIEGDQRDVPDQLRTFPYHVNFPLKFGTDDLKYSYPIDMLDAWTEHRQMGC